MIGGGVSGALKAALSSSNRRYLKRIARAARSIGSKWAVKSVAKTVVRQKKKGRSIGIGDSGDRATHSVYKRKFKKYPLPRGVKRALAPRYVTCVASGSLATPQGLQGVATLPLSYLDSGGGVANQFYLFGAADLGALFINAGFDEPTLPGTAPLNNLTKRIIVDQINADVRIKSACNGEQKLTLYTIVNRVDANSGGTAEPTTRWSLGIDETTPGPAVINDSDLNVTFMGMTPFRSPLFCQYYKVAQVKHLSLAGGAEHVHHIRLNTNKVVEATYGLRSTYQGGRTHWLIAVLQGPVATSGTVDTNVGIAQGEIHFVTTTRYKFQQLNVNRTVHVRYNGLPVLSTPRMILEDVDTAGDVQTV